MEKTQAETDLEMYFLDMLQTKQRKMVKICIPPREEEEGNRRKYFFLLWEGMF